MTEQVRIVPVKGRMEHSPLLLKVEESSDIAVHFLSEMLGFDQNYRTSTSSRERAIAQTQAALAFTHEADPGRSANGSFWGLKRIVDWSAAALLMIMVAPIAILVALVVAWDVGFPLLFWQQRPGLYGRPFKLYKFRTMAASHDKYSRRIPDEQRLSAVGQLLRRTRLDELPQLYNVLIGDIARCCQLTNLRTMRLACQCGLA